MVHRTPPQPRFDTHAEGDGAPAYTLPAEQEAVRDLQQPQMNSAVMTKPTGSVARPSMSPLPLLSPASVGVSVHVRPALPSGPPPAPAALLQSANAFVAPASFRISAVLSPPSSRKTHSSYTPAILETLASTRASPATSHVSMDTSMESRSRFLAGMTELERRMAEVKADPQLTEAERARLLKSILADYLRQRSAQPAMEPAAPSVNAADATGEPPVVPASPPPSPPVSTAPAPSPGWSRASPVRLGTPPASPALLHPTPTPPRPRTPQSIAELSPSPDHHEPRAFARSPQDVSKGEISGSSFALYPADRSPTLEVPLPSHVRPPAPQHLPTTPLGPTPDWPTPAPSPALRHRKAPSPVPDSPSAPPLQRPVGRASPVLGAPPPEPPPQIPGGRASPPKPVLPPTPSAATPIDAAIPLFSTPAPIPDPILVSTSTAQVSHRPRPPPRANLPNQSAEAAALFVPTSLATAAPRPSRLHQPALICTGNATLPCRGVPLMQGTRRAMAGNHHSEPSSPFQSIEHVMVATHHPAFQHTQELEMRANLELESISWHRDDHPSDSDGDTERPTFTLGHALQLVKARSGARDRPPGTAVPMPPPADPLPVRRTSSVCASVATDLSGVSSIPLQSLPPPSSPSLLDRTASPPRPPLERSAAQQWKTGRPARPRPAAAVVAAPLPSPHWWGCATLEADDDLPAECASGHSFADEDDFIHPTRCREGTKGGSKRRNPTRVVRQPLPPPQSTKPSSIPAPTPPKGDHTLGVVSTYRNQAVFAVEESADGGGCSSDSDSDLDSLAALSPTPRLELRHPSPPVSSGRAASPSAGSAGPRRVTVVTSAARASPVPSQSDHSVKSTPREASPKGLSAAAPREVTWVSSPKLAGTRHARSDSFEDAHSLPTAQSGSWTAGWGRLGGHAPPPQPANSYVWAALRQCGAANTDEDSD
eukprot:EG_transcript_905